MGRRRQLQGRDLQPPAQAGGRRPRVQGRHRQDALPPAGAQGAGHGAAARLPGARGAQAEPHRRQPHGGARVLVEPDPQQPEHHDDRHDLRPGDRQRAGLPAAAGADQGRRHDRPHLHRRRVRRQRPARLEVLRGAAQAQRQGSEDHLDGQRPHQHRHRLQGRRGEGDRAHHHAGAVGVGAGCRPGPRAERAGAGQQPDVRPRPARDPRRGRAGQPLRRGVERAVLVRDAESDRDRLRVQVEVPEPARQRRPRRRLRRGAGLAGGAHQGVRQQGHEPRRGADGPEVADLRADRRPRRHPRLQLAGRAAHARRVHREGRRQGRGRAHRSGAAVHRAGRRRVQGAVPE